jgi:hypothetical protein
MNAYRILVGKPEGRRPLEDQDVVGWTILKIIILNWGRLYGLVVRVPGYRSRGLVSIQGTTRFSQKQWVWNGVHRLMSIIEQLLERKK